MEQPKAEAAQVDTLDDVFKGTVLNKNIVIDRRKDELILTDECKKVMRNLCRIDTGPMDFSAMTSDDLTQPSFLSPEEKILFFKMKMFYLLQERACWLRNQNKPEKKISDAYPSFLSPFGEVQIDSAAASRTKRRRKRKGKAGAQSQDATDGDASSGTGASPTAKGKSTEMQKLKSGLNKFSESIKKADQSTYRMLEEKILKTAEGKGFACLFAMGTTKTDMELSIFPDFEILMNDGSDEESKLNNLMTHVRTRTKIFEKLQLFHENPKEDNIANVFTTQNTDATEINSDVLELVNKKFHKLDVKKISKLYDIFKDDYASAKTTLIADGTQPVILNRKKAERIKKYVDEYADLKNLHVPYNRETNFMFMTVPWTKDEESKEKIESASKDQNPNNNFIPRYRACL